jgi:WD40 repeat protein
VEGPIVFGVDKRRKNILLTSILEVSMNVRQFIIIITFALGLKTLAASNARYQIVSSDEKKRSAALATALNDLAILPKELINIINEYGKIKITSEVVVKAGSPITTLVALPDGRMVSAGQPRGLIQIWKPDGSLDKELIGHTDRVMSLLMVAPYGLVSGSCDTQIKVWDVDSGQCVHSYTAGSCVTSLICLPGNVIAAGDTGSEVTAAAVSVWNLQKQQQVKRFVAGPQHWWSLDRYPDIYALSYLPKRNLIVSAGVRGSIKLWDLGCAWTPFTFNSGLIKTFSNTTPLWSLVPRSFVSALVTLPDESIVSAWSNGAIKIFDSATGKQIVLLQGHKGDVNALLLMSPTMLISGSEDKTIKVWDLSKQKDQCIATLFGHTNPVTSLAKVDDKTFLSGSEDGTVCKWTWSW